MPSLSDLKNWKALQNRRIIISDFPIRRTFPQLKICGQTLTNNNIKSRSDCDRLKAFHQETSEKIAVLKSNFENCKLIYDVYSDIAETYYDISKEDYISSLISEKKREEEKRMKQHKLHGR